jgi:hypothetical protein
MSDQPSENVGTILGLTKQPDHFLAGLIATATFTPGVAAFATVVAYVLPIPFEPQQPWMTSIAVIVGALVGLLSWLLAAGLCRHIVSASRMNIRTYGELRQRLSQLDARLTALCSLIPDQPAATDAEDCMRRMYYAEACLHRDAIACELGQPLMAATWLANKGLPIDAPARLDDAPVEGLRWLMGSGYMNVWSRMHRAEEALIQINPIPEVISDAVYDYSRLYKSGVPNCEGLRTNIATAIKALDPAAQSLLTVPCDAPPDHAQPNVAAAGSDRATLNPGAVEDANGAAPTNGVPGARAADASAGGAGGQAVAVIASAAAKSNGAASTSAPTRGTPSLSAAQARGTLREIRCSINTFRDYRWDALIRARNRCMRTGLLTGLAAYVLLLVAILMGAHPATIVAATAFYLVGALVGLFSKLRADAQSDRAVEDYGLASVRLIFTPLFSGLAAIGGVVLINLLPVQAQSTPADAMQGLINLTAVFSLTTNKFGLIVAAIFGLTPGLLIDRLLQSTDQYKAELQNTEGGKGMSASASANDSATTGTGSAA